MKRVAKNNPQKNTRISNMLNLLNGLKKFSDSVYPNKKELFSQLAQGQKPHTLFITCSDSRIDPNLITQTEPGELFVLRNAGNIVPPFGASKSGEEAAIEFGIQGLGVKNIIVCGHSKCGAMAALAKEGGLESFPSTKSWLQHSSSTKEFVESNLSEPALNDYIEENVLAQIKNLKTHPAVKKALESQNLSLFAWLYHFEFGKMVIYKKSESRFLPFSELTITEDNINKEFSL